MRHVNNFCNLGEIMKCITFICFIILTLFILLGANAKISTKELEASDFLRIHIRANSNETNDQVVKYAIKNRIVEFVTPLLVNCNTKNEVVAVLKNNKVQIEKISNEVLMEHSFSYKAKMQITKEYFPTRMYDNVLLKSGTYDALVLELGQADGNNWWCVVYPPLCFVNDTASTNITYRSKLIELIEKFFK